MMIIDPDQPFTFANLQTMLRQNVGLIPRVLMDWQHAEGLMKDVPILPPDSLAPKAFESLKGTVRVTETLPEEQILTLGGLLETDQGALVLTAIVISPADLSTNPDPDRINEVLSNYGHKAEGVPVEVVALLGMFDDSGKPAGVVVSRPLVAADPKRIVREATENNEGSTNELNSNLTEQTLKPNNPAHASNWQGSNATGNNHSRTQDTPLVTAARLAIENDHPIVGDHGQPDPWLPILDEKVAEIWGTFFAIARSATTGLAARGAGDLPKDS